MRWHTLAWLAACTASTVLGCGKKVDCKKLCDREAQCVAEISVVTGAATPEQTARLKDEDRSALGEQQRERCMPDCESPTKPSSVHSKWRRCLRVDGCDAFAKCVYR